MAANHKCFDFLVRSASNVYYIEWDKWITQWNSYIEKKTNCQSDINKKFNSTSAFIATIVQVVPTNLNNCTVQGPSMCIRVAEWINVFNHMCKYQTWNEGTSWHRDRFYSSWLCLWCVRIRVTGTVRCHLVTVLQLGKQSTDKHLARSLIDLCWNWVIVPSF